MHFARPTNVYIHEAATKVNQSLDDDGVVAHAVILIRCTLIWTYDWYVRTINSPCYLGKAPIRLKSIHHLL